MEAESLPNCCCAQLGNEMRVVADRWLEVGDQVRMDLRRDDADGEATEGIKQEKFSLDTGAAKINLPGLWTV